MPRATSIDVAVQTASPSSVARSTRVVSMSLPATRAGGVDRGGGDQPVTGADGPVVGEPLLAVDDPAVVEADVGIVEHDASRPRG